MSNKCVVSLLAWDSPLYTRNLLLNLEAFLPGEPIHLRILDQGSDFETRNILKEFSENRENVSVEYLVKNIGYSAGHNRNYAEIRKICEFDYFVTISNDVLFGATGWLTKLVAAMNIDPTIALAGPFCCKRIGNDVRQASLAECARGDFLFVTGAISIIRAETVQQLGLFDTEFTPAYWEDADMAMRYQHYGFRQLYVDLPVMHGYLGDSDRVNQAKKELLQAKYGDFRSRNMARFFARWLDPASDNYPSANELPNKMPGIYVPGRSS